MEEKMLAMIEKLTASVEKKLAEGEKAFKDSEGKVVSLEETLADLSKKYAELEASMAKRKWADVPGVDEGKEKFSLCKAIHAISSKNWADAGYEKEVMEAARTKAMAAGTDTAGGYLVPAQAIQNVIELLRANLVVEALGANVMTDLRGVPVEIPKQTAGAVGYWVDENKPIDFSQLELGQVALNPKGLGTIVKLSNRLIALSTPSAEALVRSDIAFTLAEMIDKACLMGLGTAGQPLGIVNVPGIGTVDFSATTAAAGYLTNPGWEQMIDMEGALEDANALRGNLGYAFAPVTKRNLAKLRVASHTAGTYDGDFIGGPILTNDQIAQILGYPFRTTTNIPKNLGGSTDETQVIFGNWADLIVGHWVGMTLMASQEAGTAFQSNQTWVRMVMDVDCAVRRPESFCLGHSVKTKVTASSAS